MDNFVKRSGKIITSSTTETKKYWINSSILGVAVFIAGSLYLYARRGNFDLYIANKSLASASLVLIGLSMAFSGLCYFWDFADTKLIYRKYLGVVGFVMAAVHAAISLWFLPNKFKWPSYFLDNLVTFGTGLAALMVLAGMVALSHQHAARKIGGVLWRKLLRWGGYSAVLLIMIHFGLMKYNGWIRWFKTNEPWLPPLSFWIMIFAITVILLRAALWWSESKKKK